MSSLVPLRIETNQYLIRLLNAYSSSHRLFNWVLQSQVHGGSREFRSTEKITLWKVLKDSSPSSKELDEPLSLLNITLQHKTRTYECFISAVPLQILYISTY